MSPSNDDEKPSSNIFKERRFKLSRCEDRTASVFSLLLTCQHFEGPVIAVGELLWEWNPR